MSEKRNPSVQSVERAVSILKSFSTDKPELGLGEISRRVDLPKSTVFRLLSTLETCGVVAQNSDTGQYRLGIELIPIANSVFFYGNLREVSRPHLRRLVENLKETGSISVLVEKEIINLEQSEFSGRLVMRAGWAMRRIPFNATASGKTIAAYLPDDQLSILLDQPLSALTPNTITDPDAIQNELERVRKRGYATAYEEVEIGLHAVAAPIWDHEGSIAASVSVSGPSYRLSKKRVREIASQIIQTANQISQDMGYMYEAPT
jgi:DNA-binding IclR family transcriptional regulator